MIKNKTKILLISVLSVFALFFFTGSVRAAVAADADTYCARIHGTGNDAWIQCVEEKNTEIAACSSRGDPALVEECRIAALTYTENPTNTNPGIGTGVGPPERAGEGLSTPEETNARVEQALQASPIYGYLIGIINFLSIGVGIVITISVAVAGIQYSMSRGDPAQTAKAVNRITYALLALFLYVFGWSILNWLIPGGALNGLGEASGGIILWL